MGGTQSAGQATLSKTKKLVQKFQGAWKPKHPVYRPVNKGCRLRSIHRTMRQQTLTKPNENRTDKEHGRQIQAHADVYIHTDTQS